MYQAQENDIAKILMLRVLAGTDEVKRSVYSKKACITLGRDAYADVSLDDPTVSRVHAVIYRKVDGFVLYDRSSNGTVINGKRVFMQLLQDKDVISIGPFLVAVEIYQDCESSFHERAVAEGWTIDDERTVSRSALG